MRIAIAMLVLAACGAPVPESSPDAPTFFQPDGPFWLTDTDGPVSAIGADAFGAAWIVGGDAPGADLEVHRMQLDTSRTDRLLYRGTGHTAAIAIQSPWIFWADADHGTIERLPYDGGTPTAIVSGLSGVTELVADADRVYWVAPDGVHAVDHDGGGAVVLDAEQLGAPRHPAIGADRVYWVADDGTWEMPKAGGARGSLSPATGFVGASDLHEAAITDAAHGTIRAFDDLHPSYAFDATGALGPIAVAYPISVWAEGRDFQHGVAAARVWRHDAERGQTQLILDGLRPSVVLAGAAGLVYYGESDLGAGAVWVAPMISPP